MHHKGLYACQDFSEAACVVKIVEVVICLLLLCLVVLVVAVRLCSECRLSFYLAISTFMMLTLSFMVANAFRTDLRIFFSLVNYSYSVYFSLIVLKLGLKLIKIIRSEINYPQTRKTVIVVFGGYQILLLGALGYSIAKRDEECFALPFLLANCISLVGALLFLVIAGKHKNYQEQRLDLNLSKDKQSNPLPRFQLWVAVNFLGQVMVLIESVIFQLNNCQFAVNEVVNEVCRLIFQFLSYHLGIAATVYFFHLSNRVSRGAKGATRTRDSTFGDTARGIELVNIKYTEQIYREKEDCRQKTNTV